MRRELADNLVARAQPQFGVRESGADAALC